MAAINKVMLSKDSMLKEYEFMKSHKKDILTRVNSNRIGISNQFRVLSRLEEKGVQELEDLIELDLALGKLNTYIAIAFLNAVQDHDLELKYITRLPSLLFKMHLNKLLIIKRLKISGSESHLIALPPEIGFLTQLKELNVEHCQLDKIPKEIGMLKNLEKLNLDGNQFTTLPKEIGELSALKELDISDNPLLNTLPDEIESLTLEVFNHQNIKDVKGALKQFKGTLN